jgi:hypothetical protein
MFHFLLTALACAAAGGGAQRYQMEYRCPPGSRFVRDMQETGEFTAITDLPGSERFEGKMEGRGKIEYEIGAFKNDRLSVKIRGTWQTSLEINDSPMDTQTEDIGPGTLQVNELGEVEGVDLPPFEASAKSIVQLRWWNYITKQLNLIDGLPAGTVRTNDSWDNRTHIKGPTGEDLVLTTKSTVMGNAWNDGNCVWIRSESRLPLNLRFETEHHAFQASGNVDMTSVICFNLDKSYPTEKTTYRVASLSFHSRAEPEVGVQGFSMRLVFMSRNRSKTRMLSEEESESAGRRSQSTTAPLVTKPHDEAR